MKEGSVIAVDNAIKVLAAVASQNNEYNKKIFPFLLDNLSKFRQKKLVGMLKVHFKSEPKESG